MARPLWSDAGTDPEAIADRLDELASTATTLRFEPRQLPELDRNILHRAALTRARRQLAERHGEKDRILAEEVRAIDDLVRTANLMVERLREWYALHAPEATRMTTDAKKLAEVVAEHGDRTAVMAALDQAELASNSLGTDLDPRDLAAVQGFAVALKAVHDSWAHLETRVGEMMEELAPNLSSVVGPVIGARLIASAGSLQKLAIVSTGTVQLYGAETALFRHIKEGTKPPKHGILFQHPKVHQAPPWQRGSAARSIAIHASLGAKADAFTGNDLREHLTKGIEDDLRRISQNKPRPKPREPHQQAQRGGHRGPGKFGGKPGGKPGGFGDRPGGKPSYGKSGGGGGYGGKPSGGGYSKPSGSRDGDRGGGGGFGARPGKPGGYGGKPSGGGNSGGYNGGGNSGYKGKKPDGGARRPPGGGR